MDEPFNVTVPVPVVGVAQTTHQELADDAATFSLFLVQVVSHQEEAIEAGFSPEAAEAMAVQLHGGLVARYFTQGG